MQARTSLRGAFLLSTACLLAGPLHAQGQSAEALLTVLRDELNYQILTFSSTRGWPERAVQGAPLSPNVVAGPEERADSLLKS